MCIFPFKFVIILKFSLYLLHSALMFRYNPCSSVQYHIFALSISQYCQYHNIINITISHFCALIHLRFRWRPPCFSLIFYSFRHSEQSKRRDIFKLRLKTILLLHLQSNDWNDWSNQQIVHVSTGGECLESVKFTKWCDFNVAVDNLAGLCWRPVPQCPLRTARRPKWPIWRNFKISYLRLLVLFQFGITK